MSILISIIAFVIILVILVVVHELGHFLTAKWRGVQVMEFGIGFPPRIWGIKRGETLYSINVLPLGGFVKLAGEEDPNIPRSLASKGYGTRILVLAAGSLMNLLLPFVLLTMAFMIPHSISVAPVTVYSVIPGSQSEKAGILVGDTIVSINEVTVNNTADVQRTIMLNLGKPVDIVIKHVDSSIETIRMTPLWKPPQGQGTTGLGLGYKAAQPYTEITQKEPLLEAIPAGAEECYQTLVLFKNEIIRWIIGATTPQVTGPVGMAELTGEVAKAGISPLFEYAAFISINLAIINILPLPALDGGRIVFVLLEMVRGGRKISAKTEGLIHMIGFMLLIGLMLLVTFGDISNIITTGSALP
jgi:regulator of sigma E protease